MNNDVDEIKARLNITDVVGSYVGLKKSGTNYKGLCPFHSEKTPSFMVNPERQIYKCFGCSEGGDIFEFVMKMENLNFPEALQLLADKAGIKLTERKSLQSTDYSQQSSVDSRLSAVDVKSRLYQINSLATQVFHKVLLSKLGKDARDYLKKRGLTDETITTFRIGLAPDSYILSNFLNQRGFTAKEIDSAGRPDRFRNRIIFPITDVLGNVLGFTGRAILPDQQPKYYNTSETPIFKKSRVIYGLHQAKKALRDAGYAVLMEGQMDVVLAHQAGVRNAVASSGTALTEEHLRIIRRYTENLCFSFDMDEAGQKATLAALPAANLLGFTIKVASLPEMYKDAGEAILDDPGVFKKALQQADYGMEWAMARAIGVNSSFDPAQDGQTAKIRNQNFSVTEKKRIAKEILPLLGKMSDPIEQAHWTGRIARKLDVPEASIKTALARIKSQELKIMNKLNQFHSTKVPQYPSANGSQDSGTKELGNSGTKNLSQTDLLYGLLINNPEEQSKYQAIYTSLQKAYTGDVNQLALAAEEFQKTLPPESLSQEIGSIVARLKDSKREQIKHRFANQIAEAEEKGDRTEVKRLMIELHKEMGK